MSEKTKCVIAAIAAILLAFVVFTVRGRLNESVNVDDPIYHNQITEAVTENEEVVESESHEETLRFRNSKLLMQHYEKHGKDMGFATAEEYEKAAAAVPANPKALHKTENDDGDDVYYVEATNEFVIVSTDGYIRTYFLPDSGIKYFNKQ